MEIKILDMIQNLHNPITYTAQNEKIWTGHVGRALH